MIDRLRERLRSLLHRRDKEAELNEELQFHLDEEAEEFRDGGLDEDEARMAARRGLGNVALVSEDVRAAWGWTLLEQFFSDLRYGLRAMSVNRLFSILAIASLALGIGANTAIYSFMDAILMRSLPVRDPQSLALINWEAKPFDFGTFVLHSIDGGTREDNGKVHAGIFPYPAFELFRRNNSVFSSIFAYHRAPNMNVAAQGQAYLASAEYVSGDYFRGLEVPPEAGRLLISDDDLAGAPPVAVLSLAFSQKSFGGPANAAGKTILINNVPFTVAGVTPAGFFGVDPAAAPDVFLPLHTNVVIEAASQFGTRADSFTDNNFYWIEVMGRLHPGATLEQAQATLAPPFASWVATTATNDKERANLPVLTAKPGGAGLDTLRRRYSRPLYVLMTLVGLILAIACANVANLLLARASARRREIALRLSIGAGRFRLIRQFLTESLLLSFMGGAAGLLVAIWGIRFLTLLLANGNPEFTLHAEINWRVLAAAAALSMLTGIVFGLAPALQSTRVDVISAIKETRAGRLADRRSRSRLSLSQVLIAGQIAVSLLLLIAAGLFVRTLSNLQSVEVGFNRENMLLFTMNARQAGLAPTATTSFYADLLEQFKDLPGVRSATLSNRSLIEAGFNIGHSIPGKRITPGDRMLVIGPSYFRTMQIPLLAGREIDERDRPNSQPVAMISEEFARLYFAGEDPIGKHVILNPRREQTGPRDMEIVGVARNARYGGIKQKLPPVLYVPYNQGFPFPEEVTFELRTGGDPLAQSNTVREIVRRADSRVPVSRIRTQSAEIDRTINQEIVFARLCTAFAVLALVIACVGLYGTVSYNVARRTGEIGIRMALGARRAQVVRLVLVQVVALAIAGLALGFPAALGMSKLVASLLFNMQPNDPVALASAAAILLAAAIFAGYVPARRASRIDPMAALRHE